MRYERTNNLRRKLHETGGHIVKMVHCHPPQLEVVQKIAPRVGWRNFRVEKKIRKQL